MKKTSWLSFFWLVLSSASLAEKSPVFVNAANYGVVPGNSDNANKLLGMRNALIQKGRENTYQIYFPPGTYRYSNNRWLAGLHSVELKGAVDPNKLTALGYPEPLTKLQNISSSIHQGDVMPFFENAITMDWGDIPFESNQPRPHYAGHLIKCAFNGNKFIETGDTAFNVGDRVLIAGLNQQNEGYPFNTRYFEFNQVAAVMTTPYGMRLELTNPLQNNYDCENWWDHAFPWASVGKPRVYKLDRENHRYFRNVKLSNFVFLPNPSRPYLKVPIVFSGANVQIENILGDFAGFNVWVRETQKTTVKGCLIGGVLEIDKQVESALVERNLIKGQRVLYKFSEGASTPTATPLPSQSIVAGTSCNRLEIKGNTLFGSLNTVCKELVVKDNLVDISGNTDPFSAFAIGFYNGNWGGRETLIQNNQIRKLPNQLAFVEDRVEAFPANILPNIGVSIAAPDSQGNTYISVSVPESDVRGRMMGLYKGTFLLDTNGLQIASFLNYSYFYSDSEQQNKVVLKFLAVAEGVTVQKIRSATFRNFNQVQKLTNSVVDVSPQP